MCGWISLFKKFHSQAVEGGYPASTRALYNFFLGEINARYDKTDELHYTERELSRLTGLPKTTLHDAIKFLRDRGFIKTIKPEKKIFTIFKICQNDSESADVTKTFEQSPTVYRPLLDRLPNDSENPDNAYATNTPNTENTLTISKDIIAREEILPPAEITTNSKSVLDAWNEAGGYGEGFALIDLEQKFGANVLINAINIAKNACKTKRGKHNPRLHFNFFKSILDRIILGGNDYGKRKPKFPINAAVNRDKGSFQSVDWQRRADSFFG